MFAVLEEMKTFAVASLSVSRRRLHFRDKSLFVCETGREEGKRDRGRLTESV